MTAITLDPYMLATSKAYIDRLLGTRVAYTTPAGTRIVGTITRHPMYGTPSGPALAVTTDSGQWAALGYESTVELIDEEIK